MAMSDLPRDLAEEVFTRVPLTSLRSVSFTCKNWNTFSKNQSFTRKHIAKTKAARKKNDEFPAIMMMDFRVYLTSVDLNKEESNVEPSIKREGKLITLNDANGVDISRVFHCRGLVLCITKDNNPRLVVWNPYCGQTRWIQPRFGSCYHISDTYALGYKKQSDSRRSYKILRFGDGCHLDVPHRISQFEIYSFNSSSWKVVDVTPDWYVEFDQRGVSHKGNTYWLAKDKTPIPEGEAQVGEIPGFLTCFDFKRERFGPRLPLPFHSNGDGQDTVTLSSVGGKQLAVLFQHRDTLRMKIWITNKIEPNDVSWSNLLFAVNMGPITGFQFQVEGGSFFIDVKKKVVVVLDKDKDRVNPTRNIAYIIGKNGYFKQVDLGESVHKHCWPFVCPYLPSSVQIKQAATRNQGW